MEGIRTVEVAKLMREAILNLQRVAELMQCQPLQSSVGEDEPRIERVKKVLSKAGSRGLSANEIAARADMLPGTVRMILYSNEGLFNAEHISPRRVRWRLADNATEANNVESHHRELVHA